MSLGHARISNPRVMPGPWHTFDHWTIGQASITATCGLQLPADLVAYAETGRDIRFDVACGDCVKAEALRLAALARDMAERGYRSIDGYCRHGVYVGGSGIDWMCGTCESYSLDEEVAEIRLAAADTLRTAVYS